MKFLLFPLLLLISLSSHSNDFKFVCHTQSFVQADSDEKKQLRLRNTDESGKINSKQIIVVIKKDNNILYRVIFIDGDKHNGLVNIIPIVKTSEDMIFASIVRSDNIESIVVNLDKKEITRSWQSNDLVVAKYANCYEEDD